MAAARLTVRDQGFICERRCTAHAWPRRRVAHLQQNSAEATGSVRHLAYLLRCVEALILTRVDVSVSGLPRGICNAVRLRSPAGDVKVRPSEGEVPRRRRRNLSTCEPLSDAIIAGVIFSATFVNVRFDVFYEPTRW